MICVELLSLRKLVRWDEVLMRHSVFHGMKCNTSRKTPVRFLMPQVAYLLIYGELPGSRELARWDEALMRHSAVPDAVERAVAALPHDAHFMGIVLTAINALSTVHPEQNPALAGQNIYKSREIQDKQIVRLIGTLSLLLALSLREGPP